MISCILQGTSCGFGLQQQSPCGRLFCTKSAVPHGWLILSLQSDCFCCWCGGRELVRHQRRHERRESKWKCVAFKASRLPHDPEQSKPGTKKSAPKVRPPSLQFQTRLISSD